MKTEKQSGFKITNFIVKAAKRIADVNIIIPFTKVSTSPPQESLKEPRKSEIKSQIQLKQILAFLFLHLVVAIAQFGKHK